MSYIFFKPISQKNRNFVKKVEIKINLGVLKLNNSYLQKPLTPQNSFNLFIIAIDAQIIVITANVQGANCRKAYCDEAIVLFTE